MHVPEPRTAVIGQAVRWVDDEPQPGIVEVRLLDANHVEWTFIDKEAVFGSAVALSSATEYPVDVELECVSVSEPADAKTGTVRIRLAWGLESEHGQTEFEVEAARLVPVSGT